MFSAETFRRKVWSSSSNGLASHLPWSFKEMLCAQGMLDVAGHLAMWRSSFLTLKIFILKTMQLHHTDLAAAIAVGRFLVLLP
ncbi:hypothetical protein AV530_016300 [Patagioenas fasciata monilis]|uniref:Uncharacterized protein n=1 Tax=Patagioenas fasciata monilis TaxID=372326 RepID=A0A1V4JX50_PATFA|nr:hypothetical protein AV530_016300 [Patagioenas fasciata monilis]